MNKVVLFFSKRSVGLFILFLSIIHRVVNVLFVSYYGRDKLFLVMQSKSLLEGNGLGVPQYLTSDTVHPVFDFTPLWPPGYPLLLAPFLKLFNYNIYWATTTLDIIACVALIFIVRRICDQCEFSTAAKNIITLIAGCFEYTFINESLPTDTISLVLFLIGLSLVLKLILANVFSSKQIIPVSIVLCLPCFFRYNYPAVTFSLITAVIFIGYMKNDSIIRKKGWRLFAVTAVFTVAFFVIMKITTGQATYATATERGFYPENIAHWFPVVPSSLINIAFLTSQLIRITGIPFSPIMQLLELINVLAVVILLFVFFKSIFKRMTFKQLVPYKLFMVLGGASSIGLFVLLGYMSLTYKSQAGIVSNWNYVYEARYFAFTVVFLQLIFLGCYFVFYKELFLDNILLKLIGWVCLLLFSIEVTHNIYFHSKVSLNFKEYKSSVYREQDYSYYISLINGVGKKYPDHEIWATAPGDNFYQYLATYHGYIGLADANNFKTNTIKVNKSTILILMLFDHEIEPYNSFLSGATILQHEKKQNSNFYLIELKP